MSYKKLVCYMLISVCVLSACAKKADSENEIVETPIVESAHVVYDPEDTYADYHDATKINLDEESGTIKISEAGVYELSGTLTDGRIEVHVGKEEVVRLVLNNASITSKDGPAILCDQAKKLVISLPEETINTLVDGETYANTTSDAPSGTIFVQDDLTINGTGSLQVTGNYNDAISSKDTLKIMNGTYDISAVDDGIVGRDFLYIHDGSFTIEVDGDGLKTTYDTDTTKGDMVLEQGNYVITSGSDAIQAEHNVTVFDGTYTLTTGGGSINASTASNVNQPAGFGVWNTSSTSDSASAKGIKAGANIQLVEGTYHFDTSDDAIHSNGNVVVDGGTYTILSGDDGIHADASLTINNGQLDIQKSYEGLEGEVINLYSGNIDIIASDDGVNAAGGNDVENSSGHPGQDTFASGSGYINIYGGNLHMNVSGDGLDSNGSILMEGGNVVILGSEHTGNGALDYDGEFEIHGGTLFAVGNSGMAQHVSSSSTQYSVLINLSEMQAANETLYVSDEEDQMVIGINPTKAYNSVLISSPLLKENTTYRVFTKGSGGSINDTGYLEYGVSGGTLFDSFTTSSIVSTIGNSAMQGPGGQAGGKRGF